MKPGEYFLEPTEIEINEGRQALKLIVENTGDRPVQVGSHFHFFEVNRALKFDRAQTYGMRLEIPSGTAIRFEPGQRHQIELVPLAGKRVVHGFNRLVEGSLATEKEAALSRLDKYIHER
jgi:urease beta subunit